MPLLELAPARQQFALMDDEGLGGAIDNSMVRISCGHRLSVQIIINLIGKL